MKCKNCPDNKKDFTEGGIIQHAQSEHPEVYRKMMKLLVRGLE